MALIGSALLMAVPLLIASTGGFRTELAHVRVSAQWPIVSSVGAWLLLVIDWRRSRFRARGLQPFAVAAIAAERRGTAVALGLVVATIAAGVAFGARAAAGADPYAYVSQGLLTRRLHASHLLFELCRPRGSLRAEGAYRDLYADAADRIRTETPGPAAIIGLRQSGTLRLYANRLTVRYDYIPQEWLGRAISFLDRSGHPSYVALHSEESGEFAARFGADADAVLRRAASLVVDTRGTVTLYGPVGSK